MKATCPQCSERFSISSEMVGKKAKCGQCSHVFVIPEKVQSLVEPATVAPASTTHQAWHSLYLSGLAVLLLLFRGHQGGMIASLIFAMAIEAAAIWMAFRGLMIALKLNPFADADGLPKTALLVNGVLIGLVGLSLLLTLYALIAGQGSTGGLGDLNNILKSVKDVNKMLPQ